MGPYPRADKLAFVPRRVIPDEQQDGDPLHCQAVAAPGEKLRGHSTDGAALDKPEQHLLGLRRTAAYQEAIARQGFGVGIILGT